ncbi:UvrD-helicase domain-containing protein [Flavobacteriaceae bacterium TP-CH-4]|uniref:DNA 3'-5' helicase n=1 Tax=Pelagihabitans pacificus TaxID=2696054 RepID=A0A967ARD3_9FLAO|nr:UvrD-helicase domain-containing protein [Pelagihabitans pacificus]NHF58898.1 UvrD-helicase domain-containing protein [Pelagihabitans pacificus]
MATLFDVQETPKKDHPFKIFNASAGSGKTHTLTREYLKIVLSSPKGYSRILALTFTNKAVEEMKHRILGSLHDFANTFDIKKAKPLFLDVQKEIGLDSETLRIRSRDALKEILHNYAFFDISTIDKFTHRLIRTFAKDLKLPQNFEVILDNDLLLSEAVSRLILKAGSDSLLTQILIEFAFEKIDDDKSWDVAHDLNKIGKLLFSENHAVHLEKFHDKGIEDFLELRKLFQQKIKSAQGHMVLQATKILEYIESNGLEFADFTGGYFPKYIQKIAEGDTNLDFDRSWRVDFGSKPLYNKTCPDHTKARIDALLPEFIESFSAIKRHYYEMALLKNAYNNIVPLTVLNGLQQEVKQLQKERDQLSISEFNTIISKEIKNQPAPFIYERLGEKYRHYFIDEFQDTSRMQWENLVPLIANALESQDAQGKTGSLFLVGDAKQAIYRWRGGRAEQFLDLILNRANPFVIAPKVYPLPTNYRSHEEIIAFNNNFFTISAPFLNNQLYQQLFLEGNQQLPNTKKGGYVQLTFVEETVEEDKDLLYGMATLQTIEKVLQKGHTYSDICILVRSNKEGVALADFLTKQHIPVISSESLLLLSSEKVRFLIDLLHYQNQFGDLAISYNVLFFLSKGKESRHEFIARHLGDLEAVLKDEFGFDLELMKQKSVYDILELAIRQFNLANESDAYILFLMDTVLEVEQKEGTGIRSFLAYWEKKKDSLGLSAPDHLNAVQVMTVHKAKGLEFPIVIFPYANEYLYKRMDKKLWLPVDQNDYCEFEELLVNEKKEVLRYGAIAKQLYEEEEQKMELDAFNVLYVALTRAEKALFIVTRKQLDKTGGHNTDYYSGLFIHFLREKGLWDPSKDTFSFGKLDPIKKETDAIVAYIPYQYTHKERPGFRILTSTGNLWDTEREAALSKGNLIHEAMGILETVEDIDDVLMALSRRGEVQGEELTLVKETMGQLVHHPELAVYYQKGYEVRNEKDIMTADGHIIRPDRLVFDGKNVSIIDYKTGKRNASYQRQLNGYAHTLRQMGYVVENKIIVYINETITPEFI